MIRYKLKELMDIRNISIQEVADATGIARNTIRLMRENLSEGVQFKNLSAMLSFFKCSITDILDIPSEENSIGLDRFKNNLVEMILSGEIEKRPDGNQDE